MCPAVPGQVVEISERDGIRRRPHADQRSPPSLVEVRAERASKPLREGAQRVSENLCQQSQIRTEIVVLLTLPWVIPGQGGQVGVRRG